MVEEKTIFTGIPAFPGVIYAKCTKITPRDSVNLVRKTNLSEPERQEELVRFQSALGKTDEELGGIIRENEQVAGSFELIEILSSQRDMLQDPLLVDGIRDRILDQGENALLAIETTIQRIYEDFLALEDEYFRDRADHIQDIGKRISKNLSDITASKTEYTNLSEPTILIARDLSPSEMMELDKSKILGIATDQGGKTGHMAIIARNYGIPTIVGLKNLSSQIEDGEYILLDAERGFVKRSAPLEEFKHYGFRSRLTDANGIRFSGAFRTLDGERVLIKANLDSDQDCDEILAKNAEGVGLFRSEVLFLQMKDHKPTEEEQFAKYKKILRKMGERPVVIRVFDIGADKYEVGSVEQNPFLGNRGIRYLIRHESLYREQIRALLRASVYGDLSILIPMVTTIAEIHKTKRIISDCKEELSREGVEYQKSIPLGIMVETPACAMGIEEFSKHVDFLSVGTNDLLQYIMAVDRNNFSISDLYNPFHIVFLETLESIARVAKKRKIPVSICGELATDPEMTGILLALGYRELSVAHPFLPFIQNQVLNLRVKTEKNKLKKIKRLATEEKFFEITTLIQSESGD